MKSITIVLFMIVAMNSTAQTNLDSLLKHALQHNHEIQKSQLKVKESGYYKKEILGKGLPQVKGTATYGKMTMNNINWMLATENLPSDLGLLFQQLDGINKLYLASGTIQISQLLYSREYWVGMSAAQKEKELYSIMTSATEEDVLYNVTSTWFHIGILKSQLKLQDKALKNLEEVLGIVELNYENHMVKQTDVNRLKVAIANNKIVAKTIRDGIVIQTNLLKTMAGLSSDSTITIPADSAKDGAHAYPKSFQLETLPSYQSMTKQLELSEEQIKLKKSQYLPTLSAFAQLNKSAYNTTSHLDTWSGLNFYGINLSIPFFTSGSTRAGVKQAELQNLQLKQDIFSAKDYLKTSYDNAFANYTSSDEALTAQKENKKLAEEVYRQTNMQYKEGMASLSDLLSANNDLIQAENLFLQQLLKYRIAWIDLLKSTGSLKSTLIH